MSYKITNYQDGIDWIDVDVESGLKARLCNFGASVYELSLDGMPLILTVKDEHVFLKNPQYYGKTLGRVAGRIPGVVNIDGKECLLRICRPYTYCLHGGTLASLSYRKWDYEVKDYAKKLCVVFKIKDEDGENGFPGTLKLKITYTFFKTTSKLKIDFAGTTNKTTLLNLSNHMYFNLNNEDSISNHSLKINASNYGLTDETVFIQKTIPCDKSLNFLKRTPLARKMEYLEKNSFLGTIDNTFIFDTVQSAKPQCILQNKDVKLSLYTDYPAMNIYVDNSMTEIEFKNNDKLGMRRGIALEPQLYDLDLDSIILEKGQKYSHFMLYKFKNLHKRNKEDE